MPRRHVFDHALAQRADGLVGHGDSSCLTRGYEPRDPETGRADLLPRHPTRLAHTPAGRGAYRERFSPRRESGLRLKASIAYSRSAAKALTIAERDIQSEKHSRPRLRRSETIRTKKAKLTAEGPN